MFKLPWAGQNVWSSDDDQHDGGVFSDGGDSVFKRSYCSPESSISCSDLTMHALSASSSNIASATDYSD